MQTTGPNNEDAIKELLSLELQINNGTLAKYVTLKPQARTH